MSNQHKSTDNQQGKKNKPAIRSPVVPEQIEDQGSAAEISPTLLGAGDDDPIQRQASLLSDRRFSGAPRQKNGFSDRSTEW